MNLSKEDWAKIKNKIISMVAKEADIPLSDAGTSTDVDSDVAKLRKAHHEMLNKRGEERRIMIEKRKRGIILYNELFNKTQNCIEKPEGAMLLYSYILKENFKDPGNELFYVFLPFLNKWQFMDQ